MFWRLVLNPRMSVQNGLTWNLRSMNHKVGFCFLIQKLWLTTYTLLKKNLQFLFENFNGVYPEVKKSYELRHGIFGLQEFFWKQWMQGMAPQKHKTGTGLNSSMKKLELRSNLSTMCTWKWQLMGAPEGVVEQLLPAVMFTSPTMCYQSLIFPWQLDELTTVLLLHP